MATTGKPAQNLKKLHRATTPGIASSPSIERNRWTLGRPAPLPAATVPSLIPDRPPDGSASSVIWRGWRPVCLTPKRREAPSAMEPRRRNAERGAGTPLRDRVRTNRCVTIENWFSRDDKVEVLKNIFLLEAESAGRSRGRPRTRELQRPPSTKSKPAMQQLPNQLRLASAKLSLQLRTRFHLHLTHSAAQGTPSQIDQSRWTFKDSHTYK